jgi:hypothetical protein
MLQPWAVGCCVPTWAVLSTFRPEQDMIDLGQALTKQILQETMNFWKQTTHVMSYFKEENFRGDERLPKNFMQGFLEASLVASLPQTRNIQR